MEIQILASDRNKTVPEINLLMESQSLPLSPFVWWKESLNINVNNSFNINKTNNHLSPN